jgi:hypothetical protein
MTANVSPSITAQKGKLAQKIWMVAIGKTRIHIAINAITVPIVMSKQGIIINVRT